MSYGNEPGPRQLQTLDIYHHSQHTRAPVVVMVHGGAWCTGDKAQRDVGPTKARLFIDRGFAYVTINYRLAPQSKFPAQLDDIATAIAWVQQHIEHYGGDPRRITLVGHSAGGHLVALVIADPRYLKEHGGSLTAIKAAVLLDPAALNTLTRWSTKGSRLSKQMVDVFGQDQKTWIAASPVQQLSSAERSRRPDLILALSRDQIKARGLAKQFCDLYKTKGSKSIMLTLTQVDHTGLLSSFGESGKRLTQIFLSQAK